MEKVKGVVFELLEEATQRGDKVSLVAFRGGVPEATVALPPTSSIALARRRLEAIPLSGQTPLADALRRARLLLRGELVRHPNSVPLVVIVSDGLPTVPLRRRTDPVADLLAEGRALRRARMGCVVAEVAGATGRLRRATRRSSRRDAVAALVARGRPPSRCGRGRVVNAAAAEALADPRIGTCLRGGARSRGGALGRAHRGRPGLRPRAPRPHDRLGDADGHPGRGARCVRGLLPGRTGGRGGARADADAVVPGLAQGGQRGRAPRRVPLLRAPSRGRPGDAARRNRPEDGRALHRRRGPSARGSPSSISHGWRRSPPSARAPLSTSSGSSATSTA